MSELPFASIVVAAYNSSSTIARCIEAIQALDYPSYEIIVVDNASTDDTREIAARCPVTLLDEARRGWPAARNRAWHYSKAPLVANIDSDCFAEPSWLRELVTALLTTDPSGACNAGCAVGRTKVEPGTTLAQRFYAAADPFNFEKYLPNAEGGTAQNNRARSTSTSTKEPLTKTPTMQSGIGNGKSQMGNRKWAIPQTPSWGGGNNVVRREVIEAVGGYDALTYTSGADREFHRRFDARTPYRTVYAPRAVVWHVARGSVAEFFHQSAKFASDAVVHADFDPGVAANVNGCIRRNLGYLARNAAGFFYRGAKFLLARETALGVAQTLYWNVQALGAIWGHLKGRRRVAAARRSASPIGNRK
jgi:glycosyltransferase involved in cell wall biosynthesis